MQHLGIKVISWIVLQSYNSRLILLPVYAIDITVPSLYEVEQERVFRSKNAITELQIYP